MRYTANITTETKYELTQANSPSSSVYSEPYNMTGDIEANSYAELVQELERKFRETDDLTINSADAVLENNGGLGYFTSKALDMLYADVVKANGKKYDYQNLNKAK